MTVVHDDISRLLCPSDNGDEGTIPPKSKDDISQGSKQPQDTAQDSDSDSEDSDDEYFLSKIINKPPD